ncbi:MAG: hypothetical protein DMG12_26620, partial [Acidobacteria bacterium]
IFILRTDRSVRLFVQSRVDACVTGMSRTPVDLNKQFVSFKYKLTSSEKEGLIGKRYSGAMNFCILAERSSRLGIEGSKNP